MLDEAGLEDAIRHYVNGFSERTGIEVKLRVSPRFGRMPPDVEGGALSGGSRKPHEHPAAFTKPACNDTIGSRRERN